MRFARGNINDSVDDGLLHKIGRCVDAEQIGHTRHGRSSARAIIKADAVSPPVNVREWASWCLFQ